MLSEINRYKTLQARPLMRNAAPAMDPNSSLRSLVIADNNLKSYNSLYQMGSIRRENKDRVVNFQAGNAGAARQGGDIGSSTITDLRQMMMRNNLDNLVQE